MYTFSHTQKFGIEGDRWIIEQLEARGYDVKFDPDFFREGFDYVVNGLPTEGKIANATRRTRTWTNRSGLVQERVYHRWQWMVHHTSHQLTDWLLILVADDGQDRYPFIVPGGVLLDRNNIQITSHPTKYKGWLAQWLNRWEIIDYLANGVYRNGGPLFEQWVERVAS